MTSSTTVIARNNISYLNNIKSFEDIESIILKQSSDQAASIMKKLNISNEMLHKPPFLPKLPEKLLTTYRINSAHMINNSYIDCESISNESNQNTNVRPILKRETSFNSKGDLLRASQISLVLDSTVSDTLKRIKTGWSSIHFIFTCFSFI